MSHIGWGGEQRVDCQNKGWIVMSHIGWGGEQRVDCDVPHWLGRRTEGGLNKGWIVMSHIGWGREQTTIYKGVERVPSRCVLKP